MLIELKWQPQIHVIQVQKGFQVLDYFLNNRKKISIQKKFSILEREPKSQEYSRSNKFYLFYFYVTAT